MRTMMRHDLFFRHRDKLSDALRREFVPRFHGGFARHLLQRAFDEIGELAIDGIYGKATADAVSAFQRASLLEVTGEVDLETYNRLSRALIGISTN